MEARVCDSYASTRLAEATLYVHIGRFCSNSFNYKHSSHSKTGLYKKVVGNYPYFRRVGGRFVLASGICSFNIQT